MKVINVLLVDDDSLDILDIKRHLDKMQVLHNLQSVSNGEDAIKYLQDIDEKNSDYPDVILIDINMPRMNGLEFLREVRSNEKCKDLKCFMLTTSDEDVDRDAAVKLGISGYLVKPLKLNNLSSIDSFNLMIDFMNLNQKA